MARPGRCGSTTCIEVAKDGDTVRVWDSKDKAEGAPVLAVAKPLWAQAIESVRGTTEDTREFAVETADGSHALSLREMGKLGLGGAIVDEQARYDLRTVDYTVVPPVVRTLNFDGPEVDAFMETVRQTDQYDF